MASHARWSFAGGLLVLSAACASIAGLEEPEPPEDVTPSSTNRRDAGAFDARVSTPPLDAGVDAPPPCPKKANSVSCERSDECCSESCNQTRKCAAACKIENEYCFGDCCIGSFCSSFKCKKCFDAGAAAEKIGDNIVVRESCCTGQIDPSGLCR